MVEAAAFFHKHELHCWSDWGSLLAVVREGSFWIEIATVNLVSMHTAQRADDVIIKESVGVEERYELQNHFSEELQT